MGGSEDAVARAASYSASRAAASGVPRILAFRAWALSLLRAVGSRVVAGGAGSGFGGGSGSVSDGDVDIEISTSSVGGMSVAISRSANKSPLGFSFPTYPAP